MGEINKNCSHYTEYQHRYAWLDKCKLKDTKHQSHIHKYGCRECPDYKPLNDGNNIDIGMQDGQLTEVSLVKSGGTGRIVEVIDELTNKAQAHGILMYPRAIINGGTKLSEADEHAK